MIVVQPTPGTTTPAPVVTPTPVVAQPVGTPGNPAPYGPRLRVQWFSWEGPFWTITDPRSQVFALQGATGFRGADVEHWWTDSPAIDGSTWDGHRVARGEIFVPIRIDGLTLDAFLTVHEQFQRSLDPRHRSAFRVITPGGTYRDMFCRYVSGMDAAIELDPVLVRRATYGVTWATEEPYWSGQKITKTFGANGAVVATPAEMFPAPPMAINPSDSLASASADNPGDVEAYPIWRVNGPFTSFTIGVGTAVVTVSITQIAGQWMEVDTRPHVGFIRDDRNFDRWGNATEATLAPIQPGQNTLTTSVTGGDANTSVSVSYVPRYRSAW